MKTSLFKRRSIWVPTWRGWLVGLVLTGGVVIGCGRHALSFLAVDVPRVADVLVVEGWVPDYALEEACEEFHQGSYDYLITSGGPLGHGRLVGLPATYAELAAQGLRKLGCYGDRLLVAPAEKVKRNRTYRSAVAVRRALARAEVDCGGVNVLTLGPHAKRSRLVYQRVFPDEIEVGVISVASREYDPERWWVSSEGIKEVLTEGIAWFYEVTFHGGRSKRGHTMAGPREGGLTGAVAEGSVVECDGT